MSDELFEGVEEELNTAYAEEEQGEKPNCQDPITIERIGHDVERFSDEQIASEVKQEMLHLLGTGKHEVKYEKRMGKRTKNSAAIVHFHSHVFADGYTHILYYSVQSRREKLGWEIQAVFHLPEIYPYHWEE